MTSATGPSSAGGGATGPAAFAPPLADGDVAAYDHDAVPHYVRFFDALAAGWMIPAEGGSRVASFACRTGSAHTQVADRLGSGDALVGVDPSEPALWAARLRDAPMGVSIAYEHASVAPTPLDEGAFTHAVSVHPLGSPAARRALFADMRRVLGPGGQAVVAMPLRGSFTDLIEMCREFALKHDKPAVATAADKLASSRASLETLGEDLEAAGFVEVDVQVELLAIPFATGKEFARSAVAQLVVGPDLGDLLDVDPTLRERAVTYAIEAVAKYWSASSFELSVNVGYASAWTPGARRRGSVPPL